MIDQTTLGETIIGNKNRHRMLVTEAKDCGRVQLTLWNVGQFASGENVCLGRKDAIRLAYELLKRAR